MHFPATQPCTNDTVCNAACSIAHSIICTRLFRGKMRPWKRTDPLCNLQANFTCQDTDSITLAWTGILVTLANDQLDAQIFNTFITILYMYMFRAISCSSSGGQIVLIQNLVSSLWKQVSFLKLLLYNLLNCSKLYYSNFRQLICFQSDDPRCCMNTIWPPEDEQDIARNIYIYRIVINVLKICASSWSLSKVILRCTVTEISKQWRMLVQTYIRRLQAPV